jgi:carbonic anhydrase
MSHSHLRWSRASFLAGACGSIATTLVTDFRPAPALAAAYAGAGVPPDEALARLMRGNAAFVHEMTGARINTLEERASLSKGQAPWASILTCADSRATPEILFNTGLGDIFVCRVAGNVATPLETASLQFGSAVLGSQLILVLGHSGCGAVQAAIDAANGQPPPSEDLSRLTDAIRPAVDRAKGMKGNMLVNATKANAVIAAANLRGSAILKDLIEKKRLKIVPAYVDFATGKVSLL